MKKYRIKLKNRKNKGHILVATVMFIFILTIATVGFLSLCSYERQSVERQIALSNSFYSMEAGIEKAYQRLSETGQHGSVKQIDFPPFEHGYARAFEIRSIKVMKEESDEEESGSDKLIYDLQATGEFTPNYYFEDSDLDPIYRTLTYRVEHNSFGDYFYITDNECSPGWESPAHSTVRFWGPDVLEGKVRSNDMIHIRTATSGWGPIFEGKVISAADEFNIIYQGGQPKFENGYKLGAKVLEFPYTMDNIKENAVMKFQGLQCYDGMGNKLKYNLRFYENGQFRIIRDLINQDFDNPEFPDTTFYETPGCNAYNSPGSIYIETITEVSGRVNGDVSIGATGNLRIMDDIIYADSPLYGSEGSRAKPPADSDNYLGLFSEQNVMVANTFKNRTDSWGVCINAGIVALGDGGINGSGDWSTGGGSFSVEDMNLSKPPRSPEANGEYMLEPNGERRLTIWGAVGQRYRGYVHRTNNYGPTDDGGFSIKDYHYDTRFKSHTPPDYIRDAGGKDYARSAWEEITYEKMLNDEYNEDN